MSAIFSWNTLWWMMMVTYIPVCLFLIVIVMMQKGKGGGFAGAFGVGPGSDAVLGPRMMRSLPIKLTYGLATAFMLLALTMTIVNGRVMRGAAPDLVTESAVLAGEGGSGLPASDDPLSGLQGLQGNTGTPTTAEMPVEAPAQPDAPVEAADTAPADGAAAEATPEPAVAEPAPAEGAN